MSKIFMLISGKKSHYFLIGFCLFYLIIIGLIWVLKMTPMTKDTALMQEEIVVKNNEIKMYAVNLEKKKKEFTESKNILNTKMGLFHNDQQIEKFYEEISNLALSNGMTMKSLSRGETEELEQPEVLLVDNENTNQNTDQMLEFIKVGVFYELEGRFSDYLSMRGILANMEKIIIFDTESIERSTDGKNTIIARATIFLPKILFKREEQ